MRLRRLSLSNIAGLTASRARIVGIAMSRMGRTTRKCASDAEVVGPISQSKPGTAMENSKLGCLKWLMASYLLVANRKGISSIRLGEELGIQQKTAWYLAHRIREAWAETPAPFEGVVEADETFVGGLEKNKHAPKKVREPQEERGARRRGRQDRRGRYPGEGNQARICTASTKKGPREGIRLRA